MSPWLPTARWATATSRVGALREVLVFADIAANHGAAAREAVVRFLTRKPSLLAIPEASTVEHAEDNAGAGSLRLTESELARIDATFPLGSQPHCLLWAHGRLSCAASGEGVGVRAAQYAKER